MSDIIVGNSHDLSLGQIALLEQLRQNPVAAAKVLLGVDLHWYQIEAIEDFFLNNKRFALLKWSRQMGKTHLESVIIALQCLLYPDEVGIFLAPSQRQSLNPMNTLLRCYNNSSIFRSLVIKRTKGHMVFKNGSEITSLPMGDGCVSNCFIMTYNGFKKIDDIVDKNILKKEKIFTNDFIFGQNGFRKAEYYFYNGYVDIKKIKTNYSYTLEGSLIHPIKIVRDNKIDWVRYNDLRVGDKVIIDRTENWFEECNDLRNDDAYAIGALIGDGSYCTPSHSNSIGFSNDIKDNEIIEYINNSNFFKKYNLKFKRLENDHNHLFCGGGKDIICKYFNEFGINRMDFENNKTKNKKFPKEILSASKESMIGFIQGLMDTDGGVCKGNVNIEKGKYGGLWLLFTNTSYELVRILQIILLKFEIVSKITPRDRNEKWETIYELTINGTNVRKFYNKIGFRLKRKQFELEKLLLDKKVEKDLKDLVPHAPILLNNLINKVRNIKGTKKFTGFQKLYPDKIKKQLIKGDGLTYPYIKRFLDFYIDYNYLEEYKIIEKVYNDNYFYDTIISIEDDKADTYDVYIPDGHNFWSNGFISHNSKVLGQHATIAGIDEYARFTQEYVISVILPMLNQPGKNGLPNKLITLSTPLSKQNHFYNWYLTHKKHAKEPNSKYHLSEYDYRDSRTIDLGIIQIAMENSSWEQFARENLGIFTDNIDGFFPNDLIYMCVEEEEGSIKIQNVPDSDGKKYVLGIDPSNMVMKDRFAIYLYEVVEYEGGGLGLKFANAWSFNKEITPNIEDLIRRIMIVFNVIRCHIDAGGGGRQIAEHLMEPKIYHDNILNEDINWTGCENADVSDKTPQKGGNETPIKIIPYSTEKKNRMFFNLKNLMVKRLFKLPKNNLHDKSYIESNLLKDEFENIVTRTLNNNLLEYNHPENVGDDRVNATALAGDAFWESYYGQTQSSATLVRGVENRPFNSDFDISKPRDFNYRERELF